MIVSLLSIVINYAAASALIHGTNLGHAGLALSTSSVAIFGSVALFIILRNRIHGIEGRSLAVSIGKITIASAVMGGAVWVSSHALRHALGVSRWERLLDLAVSIPFGLVVFYLACRLLRVSELDLASRALTGPLLRRLRRSQVRSDGI